MWHLSSQPHLSIVAIIATSASGARRIADTRPDWPSHGFEMPLHFRSIPAVNPPWGRAPLDVTLATSPSPERDWRTA